MRTVLRLILVVFAAFLAGGLLVQGDADAPVFGQTTVVPLALTQDSTPAMVRVMRAGWMNTQLRDTTLFQAWSEKPGQLERAGCITKWRIKTYSRKLTSQRITVLAIDSMFYVDKVEPRVGVGATPTTFMFDPKNMCGKGVPIWHVHPPQTCKNRSDPATCKAGGIEAYQCQPSEDDFLLLVESRASFSIVQCGEKHFRFYYPYEYLSQFSNIGNSPKVLTDSTKVPKGVRK